MTTIQDFIKTLEEEGLNATAIALRLNVSQPMVSIYKKENCNINLNTALYIFKEFGVCLHPFAEESLIFELCKATKTEPDEELEDEDTDL